MNMRLFGQVPEGDVYEVTLENRRGLKASILTLGATLRSLQVPDADGELRDVVLGYDTAGEYWQGDCFLGATVGRFANRIGGAALARAPARRPAATPTASPAATSWWTAGCTNSPSTTVRTRCTAARRAFTAACGPPSSKAGRKRCSA